MRALYIESCGAVFYHSKTSSEFPASSTSGISSRGLLPDWERGFNRRMVLRLKSARVRTIVPLVEENHLHHNIRTSTHLSLSRTHSLVGNQEYRKIPAVGPTSLLMEYSRGMIPSLWLVNTMKINVELFDYKCKICRIFPSHLFAMIIIAYEFKGMQ